MNIFEQVQELVGIGCRLHLEYDPSELEGRVILCDKECRDIDSFTITQSEFDGLLPLASSVLINYYDRRPFANPKATRSGKGSLVTS